MSAKNEFPHPFGEVARQYRRWRQRLPLDASVLASNHFKENFRRQGSYDPAQYKRWAKRKNDGRGKSTRAILVKSGRLKRSLRPAPTFEMARVVSDVPYAQAHNEGFKGTVRVKGHKRQLYKSKKVGTGIFNVKSRREKQKTMRTRGGIAKVKSHSRKMNLPRRPFMNGLDLLLQRKLERLFLNGLRSIWDNARH